MTPKEFEFMVGLVERTALGMYNLGIADAATGVKREERWFAMSKEIRMTLKTQMEKELKDPKK